ncbi:MAG: hypothetical protein PHE50_08965 [Dehalococcoidales bacterium]|nr:hypothetical protein [Dehalococcoidales bacterium]
MAGHGQNNMKNIVSAIVQVLFGVSTVCFSYLLAHFKTHRPDIPGANFLPGFSVLELVLVFCGLVVAACGYLQFRDRTRLALAQIISGLTIIVIALPFAIRATSRLGMEFSNIYNVIYLLIIPGLIVSVTGIFQFILTFRNRFQGKEKGV